MQRIIIHVTSFFKVLLVKGNSKKINMTLSLRCFWKQGNAKKNSCDVIQGTFGNKVMQIKTHVMSAFKVLLEAG